MGVRENKVERYLDDQVKRCGGITRKWVSPGRDGVPDRIVIHNGTVVFVEVKTTDGKLSSAQMREHDRLREQGVKVVTVYGEQGVDVFINAEFFL
jgi:Holliday junction resolvase-like predicted endonuclease